MDRKLFKHITKILLAIGFSTRHSGFSILRDMIIVSAQSGKCKMKELYCDASRKQDMPEDAIENALRVAIGYAENQETFLQIERVMGVPFLEKNFHFSPHEFVSLMTEYIVNLWDGTDNIFTLL